MNFTTLTKYSFFILIFGGLFLSYAYQSDARFALGKKVALPESPTSFFSPPLTVDSTKIFPTASECKACHGFDLNGNALVDYFGNDVNIFDDWQPTMMGMAAKDPLWRAKVSHETTINPEHKEALETVCTSCHAPMGHYNALYAGAEFYTIEDMLSDTTALDGVSCAVCHKLSSTDIGDHNSGFMVFDTARVLYGPYPGPFQAPMELYTGFTPLYGPHINDAGICASCHTLITNSVDLQGEPTGNKFVEQATYHEWLNSTYGDQDITCQACHMPRLEEPVIISSDNMEIEGRVPFALHDLTGANIFMLQLMKNNRDILGLEAEPSAFDETIAKTFTMLKTKSLDVTLRFDTVETDTAFFTLELLNKAGHKFPSGYPSRRAFVEFIVTTEQGGIIFHSGQMDDNFELIGRDSNYEPHYDVIRDGNEVQIYQLVPVDVNGNFTTILERADTPAKDNRLPPVGFTTDDLVYDTTLIAGVALTDENFNKNASGEEGTGMDILYFHIPMNGYTGLVDVTARVYYQTLPPVWVNEMFMVNTPEIELFQDMYSTSNREPVLIKEEVLEGILIPFVDAVNDPLTDGFVLYPNPAAEGIIHFLIPSEVQVLKVEVFDTDGKLIKTIKGNKREVAVEGKGLFVIKIETNLGIISRKVVF